MLTCLDHVLLGREGGYMTDTPSGGDRCQPGRQASQQCLYTWPGTLSSQDLLTNINSIVDMLQNPRNTGLSAVTSRSNTVWLSATLVAI
jgi:hypothetical protein